MGMIPWLRAVPRGGGGAFSPDGKRGVFSPDGTRAGGRRVSSDARVSLVGVTLERAPDHPLSLFLLQRSTPSPNLDTPKLRLI